MWTEPLTVTTDIDKLGYTLVTVTDARGAVVAELDARVERAARHADVGALEIQPHGTAHQTVRAAVLAIRHGLELAAREGVRTIRAELVGDDAAKLIAAVTGDAGDPITRGRHLKAGQLHEIRTAVLQRTQPDGSLARRPDAG